MCLVRGAEPVRQIEGVVGVAERLGADTPEKGHVLHGLIMERVEVYQPPSRTQFGGMLGEAEAWVNGAVGWREPSAPFCR